MEQQRPIVLEHVRLILCSLSHAGPLLVLSLLRWPSVCQYFNGGAVRRKRGGILKYLTQKSATAVLLSICCAVWPTLATADLDKARTHLHNGEHAEAFRELQPLAKAGDPVALNMMGVLYHSGQGVTRDQGLAADYFRQSAEKGEAAGQYNWAIMLSNGSVLPKDERKAAEWLQKSADQGDRDAQRELGYLYAEGKGLTKDQVKAVAWLRKAADQNDASAQYSVGWALAKGVGVPKDEAIAAEWFQKSADQGIAAAQRELGVLLFNGSGVKKDQQLGTAWLRKAADQGDITAQVNLGRFYRTGSGVPKNDQESNGWYRKAAEQGDVTAQRELGIAYAFGYGVEMDERQAGRWFRMAADQGDKVASNNLGDLYERGAGGLQQDHAEAVRLYGAAAQQGEAYGQRNLARMFREGLGIRSDAVIAYSWITLAAANESPHPKAIEERDAMAQYVPRELMAEGQRLAREWKPGNPLGKSRLKPVEVASLAAAWMQKVAKAFEAKRAEEKAGLYPARPEPRPGLTTCNTRCSNGDCYRTYGDGRKVHFQARQKWNPFNNQFEWDAGSC